MANKAKTPAAAPRAEVPSSQPAATATPAHAQPAFTTRLAAAPNGEASAFVKDESPPHIAPSTKLAAMRFEVLMLQNYMSSVSVNCAHSRDLVSDGNGYRTLAKSMAGQS